jgi:hypothetical protein
MRRFTAQFLTLAAAFAFAGCGFTPSGQTATGAPSGAGNSTGIVITGAGASSGTGNTGGSNNGNSGIDSNCGARDKPAARLPPDILLVYDASGSMNENIMNMSCQGGCGAESKWSIMAPAVNQAVMATENDVNWGLKFFASNNDCTVNANANVTVGAMRAAMIAQAIQGRTDAAGNVTNGSRTPTRAAVSQGAAYLMGVQDDNPKYIVLVTDGLPNCPMSGGSGGDDTAGAVAAVTASAAAGIPVFVVGVATAGVTGTTGVDADQVLTMMSAAGGRPRAGTPNYYSASSAAELASALTMLVGMTNSCTFQIGPAPTTDGTTSTSYIDVFGDGTKIPRDTTRTNGWDYVDGSGQNSIQIYGSTCDQVIAGTIQNLVVTYRCVQG